MDFVNNMSNELKLETRFYVTKILKNNTLTKELDLCEGCIIEVSMVIARLIKDYTGLQYARYIDIFNVCNGKEKKDMSLNLFAAMIGKNFLLSQY